MIDRDKIDLRWLALLLIAACAPVEHTVIPPHPAPTAPLDERLAYREAWREPPVADVNDLVPAVGDASPTAQAARAAAVENAIGWSLIYGGGGAIGLGIAGILLSAMIVPEVASRELSERLTLAGGIGTLVGVGAVLAGYIAHSVAAGDDDRARRSYPADLDAALALSDLPRPAPTTASSAPTPAPTSAPAVPTAAAEVSPDPLPMHVVARVGDSVIADFDAGPDLALTPRRIDVSQRELAGALGSIFGTRGSALFACFMRRFPGRGEQQRAVVQLRIERGRVVESNSSNSCVASALHRASPSLSDQSFSVELTIDHTAGPFVAPRCRQALPHRDRDPLAVTSACLGLFLSPDGVEVTRAMREPLVLAEAFREDGCPHARDLALCRRQRIDVDADPAVLRSEVRALEERYVRQLTDDGAIIEAALALLEP